MQIAAICLALLCSLPSTLANVEKTIFLAPAPIHIPREHPNLDDLQLQVLTPARWRLQLRIAASFPTAAKSFRGTETWLLLEGLEEQRRYEVRICWAATQPTSFILETLDLNKVFNSPGLISSLAFFSEQHRSTLSNQRRLISELAPPSEDLSTASHSVRSTATLFLRIYAAADYFTTNLTLMKNAPLVNVEIILDPFLLNILPRSLLPTAGYLVLIAIGAWYLSEFIWRMSINSTIIGSGSASRKKELLALWALPLYSLPAELILMIFSLLDLVEYPLVIISAARHLLQAHGIMPYLPEPRLRRLLARMQEPLPLGGIASPLLGLGLGPSKRILPPELCTMIQSYLDTEDKINVVLAVFEQTKAQKSISTETAREGHA
ncbi:hypothetical protein MMC07_003962 [Pseudocyphellaria aurata]|nr:hypothetical protein [Pseudocyphellaria aurata]